MSNDLKTEVTMGKKLTHLPTFEEVDKLVSEAFPQPGALCTALCNAYQADAEQLNDVPVKQRAAILARMKALAAQMRTMHCPACILQ